MRREVAIGALCLSCLILTLLAALNPPNCPNPTVVPSGPPLETTSLCPAATVCCTITKRCGSSSSNGSRSGSSSNGSRCGSSSLV